MLVDIYSCMKKRRHLLYGIIALSTTIFSCKKIISLVFPGKDVSLPALKINVPAIPLADSTKEFQAGSFTTYINVDSIIKANTNGAFGIGSVNSVKVKQVTLSVQNADATNNLSAFKSFRITISSNTNANTMDMVSVNIPASAVSTYAETPSNSPNITSYLGGSSINNTVYGTVRKTTTKTLNLTISILLRAD